MKPTGLIVLDGWGLREETHGNAVKLARTPNFDQIWQNYAHTSIATSGADVGLPEGQMGNSEVGHMNLGAGRVVMQDLMRINQAIAAREFFSNPVLTREFQKIAQSPRSTLHLLGLLSDGGVHSHLNHLVALVQLAQQQKIRHCFIHAFMDGRDTPPKNGLGYLQTLQKEIQTIGYGQVASIQGRFFAMDRDKRWERVEKAYEALVGRGLNFSEPSQAITQAYGRGETDEFITPSVMIKSGEPIGALQSGDGIFFFNFRPDRCREMIHALTDETFSGFNRSNKMNFCSFSTMTLYHEDYPFPVAFPPQDLSLSFGEVLERENLLQLRIAETEKFPHVTFFFSCGRDQPFSGEERILIPSPRDVKTYDLKPEMSAVQVTDALISALESQKFNFFLLNLANPDMVGHTGSLPAAIAAVETVDICLGRILECLRKLGGRVIVTADHGNCEQMIASDGSPHTSHTTNRVPLIIVDDPQRNLKLRSDGRLADIAPTLIKLMGLEKSPSFQVAQPLWNGKSLF